LFRQKHLDAIRQSSFKAISSVVGRREIRNWKNRVRQGSAGLEENKSQIIDAQGKLGQTKRSISSFSTCDFFFEHAEERMWT